MASHRVLILVHCLGLLLLGRMSTTKVSSNGTPHPWGVPGGKPRTNESILDAAIRELKEETGKLLESNRFAYMGDVYLAKEERIFHIFSVMLHTVEKPDQIPPYLEFLEFEWFYLEDLPWDEMLPVHQKWLPQMLAHDRGGEPIHILVPHDTKPVAV